MNRILLASFMATVLLAGGCGPTKPMTEKDFKGFCYQYGDGENGGDCDTVSVCDPYTVVMNKRLASLDACMQECAAIHGQQFGKYAGSACDGPSDAARDWCVKYCRSAFPK